jgi:hypothetical protein
MGTRIYVVVSSDLDNYDSIVKAFTTYEAAAHFAQVCRDYDDSMASEDDFSCTSKYRSYVTWWRLGHPAGEKVSRFYLITETELE